MTQNTDQERAEFEAWLNPEYSRELDGMDCYIDGAVYSMFSAWQAASRAQVVPKGWKLVPEKASCDMVNAGEDAFCGTYDYAMIPDAYAAMLAAAPQPPEKSNSVEFHQIKQTAPVQMPEADGLFSFGANDDKPTYHYGQTDKQWLNELLDKTVTGGPYRSECAYSESKVRQLLAAHGIK